MTLHCPHCASSIDLEAPDEYSAVEIPTACPICKKRLDITALITAVCGFPLLGADERWRKEERKKGEAQ